MHRFVDVFILLERRKPDPDRFYSELLPIHNSNDASLKQSRFKEARRSGVTPQLNFMSSSFETLSLNAMHLMRRTFLFQLVSTINWKMKENIQRINSPKKQTELNIILEKVEDHIRNLDIVYFSSFHSLNPLKKKKSSVT